MRSWKARLLVLLAAVAMLATVSGPVMAHDLDDCIWWRGDWYCEHDDDHHDDDDEDDEDDHDDDDHDDDDDDDDDEDDYHHGVNVDVNF